MPETICRNQKLDSNITVNIMVLRLSQIQLNVGAISTLYARFVKVRKSVWGSVAPFVIAPLIARRSVEQVQTKPHLFYRW